MAISFVGSGVGSAANAGFTVTLPDGMAVDDLILCFCATGDTAQNAMVAPSEGGYTDFITGTLYGNDVNDVTVDAFYKFHNGSDTLASLTGVGGANASNVAVVMVFSGVATVAQGGPFSATPTTATGINTSNADPPSIATVTDDVVVIFGGTGHTGGATAAYTSPAGYTAAVSRAHDDTIDTLAAAAYDLTPTIGTEAPAAFTAATIGTAADNAWAAITVALKVAPASVPFPMFFHVADRSIYPGPTDT